MHHHDSVMDLENSPCAHLSPGDSRRTPAGSPGGKAWPGQGTPAKPSRGGRCFFQLCLHRGVCCCAPLHFCLNPQVGRGQFQRAVPGFYAGLQIRKSPRLTKQTDRIGEKGWHAKESLPLQWRSKTMGS